MKWNLWGCLSIFVLHALSCESYSEPERDDYQTQYFSQLIDSIDIAESLIEKERNLDLLLKQILDKENDSVQREHLLKIAIKYYDIRLIKKYKDANKLLLEKALQSNDTSYMAEYHWNEGLYQLDREILDSAFIHFKTAEELFTKIGNTYYTGKMQFNIAEIFWRTKNYIKSEAFLIKAIKNYELVDKHLSIYRCFNLLGMISDDVGDYEKALEYYSKAIDVIKANDIQGYHLAQVKNNKAITYQNLNKYDEAIELFSEALNDSDIVSENWSLYVRIYENKAYSEFLNGEQNVEKELVWALKQRDSMKRYADEIITRTRLGEFYLASNDTLKALLMGNEALRIADSINSVSGKLISLKILSKIDSENSSSYLNRYIELNDNLIKIENQTEDVFARIEYETENYINANKKLQEKNIWITLSSVLTLGTIGLLFIYYRQRVRNKELEYQKVQQQTNEAIYDLMLQQQGKTEEGRLKERAHLAEELHDGVLAKLFSVRMGLGFMANKFDEATRATYDLFMKELQAVEKQIRDLSHSMKNQDPIAKADFGILLKNMLEDQQRIGKFSADLDLDASIAWNKMPDKTKMHLYRIIQEAIHNALKHAEMKHLVLCVSKDHSNVVIQVIDDGKGLDLTRKTKGIGLRNMRSRATTIGAQLMVSSKPEEGTSIQINVPYKT